MYVYVYIYIYIYVHTTIRRRATVVDATLAKRLAASRKHNQALLPALVFAPLPSSTTTTTTTTTYYYYYYYYYHYY